MISRTEMIPATENPAPTRNTRAGFTLLELVIALAMLATFIVPMLNTLGESRARSSNYTRQRQIKGYAQNKLHDHINFVQIPPESGHFVGTEGTFEKKDGKSVFPGSKDWTWVIDPPQLKSQGEQVLLEYRITVTVPFDLDGQSGSSDEDGRKESSVSYTVWTFPSEAWLDDQNRLFDDGEPTLLYGDPAYDDGLLPGGGR